MPLLIEGETPVISRWDGCACLCALLLFLLVLLLLCALWLLMPSLQARRRVSFICTRSVPLLGLQPASCLLPPVRTLYSLVCEPRCSCLLSPCCP